MRDTIVACEAAAHDGGLTSGLELALRAVDIDAPPGRVAALPSGQLPAGAAVVPHRLAQAEGITFVTWPDQPAHPAHPAPEKRQRPDRTTVFAALLGAVRVGVSRRLLDDAVAHLSGRTGGGEPLIRKQLVLGTVADVITALDAVRQLLLVAHHVPAAVADAHDRITALDWDTAKLFGASGFLADGPVRAAYVGRLAADCWTDREDVQP